MSPERIRIKVTPPMATTMGASSRQASVGVGSEESGGSFFGGDVEDRINAAKLLRACGGCLGARRRRRAWKTAISPGDWSNAS